MTTPLSVGKQIAVVAGLGTVIAGVGVAGWALSKDDDKPKETDGNEPHDPALAPGATPEGEPGATVVDPSEAGAAGAVDVTAAEAEAVATEVPAGTTVPTGVTAGNTDTGFDPMAASATTGDSGLISPEDYAAALMAAQGGQGGQSVEGIRSAVAFDRSRLPISTYPNDPGGVFSAIDRAAPQSWNSADVQLVGNAAIAAGSSAYEASRMVSEVYNSTPYSWTGSAEAQVAATGLQVHRNAADTGNVIDQVEYGTPWNWSTSSDIRLSIAALHGGVPSSRVDDVIREASNATYGEASGVALAEQRLLAGSTGSTYPSYPSYPTYPDYGNSYPTYPSYPDYDNSYPTYPSYPSYPDTSTGDSGYGYPSYPSYPDTSTGDSGYGYPDSGGYTSPGDSGYSYPSSGDSGGYSYPSDGGYSGGYTSGGDS